MPKPLFKDNLQRSNVPDEPPRSCGDTATNLGTSRKIKSVRSRFNASVVGFGIVGPSTHAPKAGECFPWNDEAAEAHGGKTLEDRK
ncbi:MAG TPA: hypothetical protein VN939_12905 [Chthoniobacterales bacterium]|nr:hypothetical protein [Chthoniobacterales bacterium]